MLPLIILAGPTASGKSKVAVALAEHFQSEIVSADSMQVYRHFDIGTAKPPKRIRDRIPHHLIDILEPEDEFTAFDFKKRAREHLLNLEARQKPPIIVGGTGLYLKTLIENYQCAVEVSPEVRQEIQHQLQKMGPEFLYKELVAVDPVYAQKIKPTDPARIERALSIYRETGKPFSRFHEEDQGESFEFEFRYFWLEPERQQLYDAIDKRVDTMMEQGLKQEVEALLNRGISPSLKPMQSIGYSHMVSHLIDKRDWDRTVEEIQRDTRHYAKRQITWFKKVPYAVPLPSLPGESAESLKDRIVSQLAACTVMVLFLLFGGILPAQAEETEPFRQAVSEYHKGHFKKSQNQFTEVLGNTPSPETGKRSKYMMARVLLDENRREEAIALFRETLSLYPQIEDYIRYDLARALEESGDLKEALKQVDLLLSQFPRTRLAPSAGLLRAELLSRLERPKDAIKQYQRLRNLIRKQFRRTEFSEEIPRILFREGELYEKLNKPQEAYDKYHKLWVHYPTHDITRQAELKTKRLLKKFGLTRRTPTLQEQTKRIRNLLNDVEYQKGIREILAIKKGLKAEGKLLPPKLFFYLANAHQGQRKRAKAIRVLREFLKRYPNHRRFQEGHFQIGRNLWNLGNPRGALEHFKIVVRQTRKTAQSAQAHFFIAKIHEDLKEPDKALKHYQILIDRYRSSSYADMGSWQMGWIHFRRGELDKAFERFRKNTEIFPYGLVAEKNFFWMAKTSKKLDRKEAAQKYFSETYQRFPFTYYGLKARTYIENGTAPASENSPQTVSVRQASFSKDSTPPRLGRRLSPRERFHLSRAKEMIALGFYKSAKLELKAMARTISKNQSGVLWLSYWYNQARGYADSQRLLHLYKNYKTKRREKDLSVEFWKTFYPQAYSETISVYAEKYRIDPLLVRGLIRQESMYDTWSLSQAGARGLMQIMPKTGKALARRIGKGHSFDPEDLHDPETNIQLGIQYLRELTRRYKDNKPHILISYNAGPKVLKAWLRRFRAIKDPDVFVESIPYPETRKYVKKVLRNYEIYKYLYLQKDSSPNQNEAF